MNKEEVLAGLLNDLRKQAEAMRISAEVMLEDIDDDTLISSLHPNEAVLVGVGNTLKAASERVFKIIQKWENK